MMPDMTKAMEITFNNLKTAGNRTICRRIRNKGFHWGPHLYDLSCDLSEIYESMIYLIELDHGWSKEYTRLDRSYRQCCRKILKHMRKTDRYYKKHAKEN